MAAEPFDSVSSLASLLEKGGPEWALVVGLKNDDGFPVLSGRRPGSSSLWKAHVVVERFFLASLLERGGPVVVPW